VGFLAML